MMPQQRIATAQMPRVDVALATYNGARHLDELMSSIERQTYANIALACSDDASQDDTIAVIQKFSLPQTIFHHSRNLGAAKNFSHAIGMTTANYVALADQDDVWHVDKISKMMSAMIRLEHDVGPETPVLVFCDLRIVRSDRTMIQDSFYADSFKSVASCKLKDFVIANHIPGCAMLINRALIRQAGAMPEGAFMHDWWLAMVAATYGRIKHVPEALIEYRQHESNEFGAPRTRSGWSGRMKEVLSSPFSSITNRIGHTIQWAETINRNFRAFRLAFGHRLPDREQIEIRRMLSRLPWVRYAAFRRSESGESIIKTWMLIALLRK